MADILFYLVGGVLALAAFGFVAVVVLGIGGTILGFAALPVVWATNIVQSVITDVQRRRQARARSTDGR